LSQVVTVLPVRRDIVEHICTIYIELRNFYSTG
jgi:hypothetical protein